MDGSKGKNATFSELGPVAYQIKGNHKCSNMVSNNLLADPSDPRSQKVKIQIFTEQCHVAYQIKGNHECSNMVAKILPADCIRLLLRTDTI